MRTATAAFLALAFALLAAIIGLQAARGAAAESRSEAERAMARVGVLESALVTESAKERIVVEYVDRTRTVYRTGAIITKEVPRYVTVEADRACPVPVGFVQLHDAAAAGVPPAAESAGHPDAPAAGIALSTVAETVAANYTDCHAVRAQLIALQDFVRTSQGGDHAKAAVPAR